MDVLIGTVLVVGIIGLIPFALRTVILLGVSAVALVAALGCFLAAAVVYVFGAIRRTVKRAFGL